MKVLADNGRSWALFIGLVWLLNFAFEAGHCVLFYDLSGKETSLALATPSKFVRLMSYAASVDTIILTVILAGGALLWRNWQWYKEMKAAQYSYFIGTALVWAAMIEYKGVYVLKQWQYNELMPTVFGLGVSPLTQLWLTGLIALAIVRQGVRAQTVAKLYGSDS